jgi:hypothetical protein
MAPESDFDELRWALEATTVQPPFDRIRSRRRHRSRMVVTGTVLVTVAAVLAGAALVDEYQPWTQLEPVGPPPQRVTVDPTHISLPLPVTPLRTISSATASPDGAVFTVIQTCLNACATETPDFQYTVMRSVDLGATWSPVGTTAFNDSGGSTIAALDSRHLWVLTANTLQYTADGGATWVRTRAPGPDRAGGPTAGSLSAAGGATWLAVNGDVLRAGPDQPPIDLPVQPRRGATLRVTAISASSAIAAVGNAGNTDWYSTTDSGAHWSPIHMPCRDLGTSTGGGNSTVGGASMSFATSLAIGPDGTRWVVCGGAPVGGQEPTTVLVSTDGGRTWRTGGNLIEDGFATDVYPESASTAWRTGIGADIYRTFDRTDWADTTERSYATSRIFVAIDTDTALYLIPQGPNNGWTEYVTRNGGQIWSARPFTGVGF